MKKIFVRASALMLAALVLVGGLVVAAPVEASAAELVAFPELPEVSFENCPEPRYVIIYNPSNSLYYAWFFDENWAIYYTESYGMFFSNCRATPCYASRYILNVTSNEWEPLQVNADFGGGGTGQYSSWLPENFLYCNFDVYYAAYDSNNNLVFDGLFFPQTPLAVIPPLVKVTSDLRNQGFLEQALAGVIQMIPIGLACWVGYKGLRKGLALLQTILHRA